MDDGTYSFDDKKKRNTERKRHRPKHMKANSINKPISCMQAPQHGKYGVTHLTLGNETLNTSNTAGNNTLTTVGDVSRSDGRASASLNQAESGSDYGVGGAKQSEMYGLGAGMGAMAEHYQRVRSFSDLDPAMTRLILNNSGSRHGNGGAFGFGEAGQTHGQIINSTVQNVGINMESLGSGL